MRIISGKYKSRKIFSISAPRTRGRNSDNRNNLRPTTGSARETIFNVLSNIIEFEGIKCLDLFAGTGSFGFECISRGAESCNFVEQAGKQLQMIKKTTEELNCTEQVIINKQDVMYFLKESPNAAYDLIFADPPYNFDKYRELINNVLTNKFSIFVLEYGTSAGFLTDMNGYDIEYDIIDKKAGITNFKIFISKKIQIEN